MTERSIRLEYIQHARNLAVLGVLFVHTNTMMGWRPGSAGEFIGDALADVSACFVFISGFLFQHLSSRFDYRDFLLRKLRHVIAPYIVLSIPAILIYLVGHKHHPWLPDSFFQQNPIMIAGYFLLTGQHLGPFWFVPMIALYFLAAPLFMFMDRRPKLYLVIAPLLLLSLFIQRSPHNDDPLRAAMHFLPAYLLGMAASHYRALLEPVLKKRFWLLFAICAGATIIAAFRALPASASLHLKIPAFFTMLSVFLRFPRFQPRWSAHFADMSFGVYLAHAYVVSGGRMLMQHYPGAIDYSIPALIAAFALVLILSTLVAEALRGISGPHSRLVIGAAPRRLMFPPHPPPSRRRPAPR